MVVSWWCFGCVPVVFWWYLGRVLMVSRWCPFCVLVVSRFCIGCVLVVFWWHLGDIMVVSRWCLGLVLVVSWWLLGGFCRVSVVSWWSCGAAAAETTAKIGSNKKRETVLLGLYAGLIYSNGWLAAMLRRLLGLGCGFLVSLFSFG